MAEPTTENLLAASAYGATNRMRQIIDAIRLLDELHGARDLPNDSRCKTCRNSRGKPEPWPCLTYQRFAALFQIDGSLDADTVTMFRTLGEYRNGRATLDDVRRVTSARGGAGAIEAGTRDDHG